jgi:hypothetical protein
LKEEVAVDPTLDRFDIIDTTVRMAWHADRREWDGLNDVLAPRVRLDYTSLSGGEAATVERGDIIVSWRNALGGLTATQHLVGNHLVTIDGDRATCTAAFQATHVLANPHGDPTWTLGGHYRFELTRTSAGWRITDLTMTADWATGNQQIMTLAVAG